MWNFIATEIMQSLFFVADNATPIIVLGFMGAWLVATIFVRNQNQIGW